MEHFFDHERLEVYQLAREFDRDVHKLLGEVSRCHAESKDNLTRAAKSITRNSAAGGARQKGQTDPVAHRSDVDRHDPLAGNARCPGHVALTACAPACPCQTRARPLPPCPRVHRCVTLMFGQASR